MPFDARVFQLAKDPQQPGQCQDAWRIDAARGRAAAADGVSAAIFSGASARILVEAAVADPPSGDVAGWTAWLAPHRRRWAEQIDHERLSWSQRAKLPAGAFSTLLWLQMEPRDPGGSEQGAGRGDREHGTGRKAAPSNLYPVTCRLTQSTICTWERPATRACCMSAAVSSCGPFRGSGRRTLTTIRP